MPSKPNRPVIRAAGVAVALASLGVLASAYAAPGKGKLGKAKRGPSLTCAKPDKAKCLSGGYLYTSCGQQHKKTCAPYIREEMKSEIEALPGAEIPMLRPKKDRIPGDITNGKEKKYAGPKGADRLKSTGTGVFARSGLAGLPATVSAGTAKNAHRNKAWEKNGGAVAECKEYAYEMLYDYMRFADAAAACKGSKQCVFDIAYMPSNPGIADRTLRRKDSKPLPPSMQIKMPKVLANGMPKNTLFAAYDKLVYSGPGGSVPKSNELDQLAAELRAGKKQYKFNCKSSTCPKDTYENEWDWHADMEKRVGKLPRAHFEEYARRRQRFADLLHAWSVKVAQEKEEGQSGKKPAATVHEWVNPLDTVTLDPIKQLTMLDGYMKASDVAYKKLQKTLPKSMMDEVKKAGGGLKARGLFGMTESTQPPVGVLAAPSVKRKKISNPHALALQLAMRKCDTAKYEQVLETAGVGPLSCKIGVFLRHEWNRKKNKDDVSCLDRSRADCDWSLEMFENRVLRGVPNIDGLQDHEELCRLIEPGGKVSPVQPTVGKAESHFKAVYNDITKTLKQLKAYDKGPTGKAGRRLEGSWGDADYFGDKKWFALGYDYSLGWAIEPTQRNAQTEVCQLGGKASASLGVNSWIRRTPISLVDAELLATVNDKGSQESKLETRVTVFTAKLVSHEQSISHAWALCANKSETTCTPSLLKRAST